MPLADARAQVPDLAIVPHDPVLDQNWLDRLAQGCARYTPLVALDAPDGLILDITGCTHLFEGEAGLIDDIDRRLTRLGMTLRHALGPTADAARALARYQTRPAPDEATAIRRLPVAALELDAEAATALVRAGLKTIGDLAARPMANIAARFGADAATALRRLLGDAPSPLDPRVTPPPIATERRFAEPVASMPHATQILTELVGEAIVELDRARQGRAPFPRHLFSQRRPGAQHRDRDRPSHARRGAGHAPVRRTDGCVARSARPRLRLRHDAPRGAAARSRLPRPSSSSKAGKCAPRR